MALGDAEAASAAGTLTPGGAEAVELAKAVQEATRMISPTTVAELSQGWDPFAVPPASGRRVAHWATLACTVLLVIAAGYYTLWQKRATDLMTFVVDQAVSAQRDAMVDLVLPTLARLGADEAPQDPLEVAILLKDIREVQDLQSSIDLFKGRFDNLYRDRIILRGQLLDLGESVENGWSAWVGGGGSEPSDDAGAWPVGAAGAEEARPTEVAAQQDQASGAPDCAATGDGAEGSGAGIEDVISLFKEYSGCLTTVMGVTPWDDAYLNNVRVQLYQFDHALSVVGSWVLPAIYGALGALIYYMRQFLDPLRKDPPIERVIIRVSLGAFAGLTVGWFFTPTTAAQGFQFPDVGMATLTFAFILGFSIEVFFGFLERMVNLSNEGIARLGRQPQ